MQSRWKSILSTNEMIVVYFIAALMVLIASLNPTFLTWPTAILLSRAVLITLIFAVCEMLVIIAGGIDVSFPAIACFTMYSTLKLMLHFNLNQTWIAFLIAAVIGTLFGLLNATLISICKIPPLIATLGVSSITSGATLAFLGTAIISQIPSSLYDLSQKFLFTYTAPTGIQYSLTVLMIIPIVLCIVVAFILRYTMLGRGIYAIGGAETAARIAGFNVRKIQFIVYVFVGCMTGIASVTYMILMRQADPKVLMGGEMMVIAAVVLGGTRITGGKGSVLGTILGVILLAMIQNNLILIGIPTHFQAFFVGLIIVIGTSITSIKTKIVEQKPKV